MQSQKSQLDRDNNFLWPNGCTLLIWPSMQLAFTAARLHCWVLFKLQSPVSPFLFLLWCPIPQKTSLSSYLPDQQSCWHMWPRSTLLSDSCPFPEGLVPQGDNQRDKSMSIKASPSLSWHPWCDMACLHPSPIPYPSSSATRLEHTFPRYLPQALERNTQHFLKPRTQIALSSLLFGSRPLMWQSQLFQAVHHRAHCTESLACQLLC